MPECPSCDEIFETERGVAVHSGHAHGPNTETCVRCGDEFRVPPNKSDSVEQCSECVQNFGHTERRNQQISNTKEGYSHSEEAKQKMSESHLGKSLSEEHKENIAEANRGEKNDMYGLYGEEHPAYGNPGGHQNLIDVEETGHTVRSSWEAEIDRLLYNSRFDYGYEEVRFELSGETYTPDFIAQNAVIEVKGYPREQDFRKAEKFQEKFSDWKYIVLGNVTAIDTDRRMSCDVHIPWEKRRGLLRYLRNR